MNTFLKLAHDWSSDVAKYLTEVVLRCSSCCLTARLKSSLKVNISSLHLHFNDVVCVYHFFLDGFCVFHDMGAATRYSAGIVFPYPTLTSALHALEAVCRSPFWAPRAAQDDG